uniref:CCHC-type domain-containing protein n=1 Tax=Cyanistes caeruleus TaxID=156563 RepID=A0A8C0V2M8_CYACU
MGQRKSKMQKKGNEKGPSERERGSLDIPLESPLRWMLKYWENCPERKKKSKAKMIWYCTEVWGGQELRNHLTWPVLGTFERWTCNELLSYVENKDPEEREYAKLWLNARVGLFPMKQKEKRESKTESWEPLDHLPPPYHGPAGPSSPEQVVPSAPSGPRDQPTGMHVSQAGDSVPAARPAALPLSPPANTAATGVSSEVSPAQGWGQLYPSLPVRPPQPGPSHLTEWVPTGNRVTAEFPQSTKGKTPTNLSSPPASRTGLKAKMMGEEGGESIENEHRLFPLREIPTAPGIIGFVNVPLNSGDVRAFKKEIGRLLDDLFGVAERLDDFLGSSIYTYDDLMAILRSLFNQEEREMIKQAGIRDWNRRNPQGTPGDQKWPSVSPSWNTQTEEGRRSMIDLRNIIVQGIREAVPRGQNISKVFGECQGKEESPTEWVERLRRSLQIYSGTDPNSPMGEVLLKTQFVAKSWEDIKRKLEKIDGWQDKSLQELLREAQKIYMRREDEKQKLQAKVLVAAVKEVQKQEQTHGKFKILPREQKSPHQAAPDPRRELPECYYCKKVGHIQRNCSKRMKDEKIFQED